jgi:hypothetical protein
MLQRSGLAAQIKTLREAIDKLRNSMDKALPSKHAKGWPARPAKSEGAAVLS